MPPAVANPVVYATNADISTLVSSLGLTLRVTDADGSGGTTTVLTTNAIQFATARINAYCGGRYSAAQLAQSWMATDWATTLATVWLCRRKGNPCPDSLLDMQDAAMKELLLVNQGKLNLEDVPQKVSDSPAWSNVRVDPLYPLRKIRVERPISDGTQTDYPQNLDYPAEYTNDQ